MTAKQIITKTAVNIGRLLVAVTFIFSGFVKGMDPLGTQYKITDYLEALHINWMFPSWSTLLMSIVLAMCEFAIGIFLLFAIRRRLMSKITLAVMSVMTLITLWIVIADPVKDCGCFGDAVVLTNMETFIKNIILLIFAVLLWRKPLEMPRLISRQTQWVVINYTFLFSIVMSIWSLWYLPQFDFRPYHIGVNIAKGINLFMDYETFGEHQNADTGIFEFMRALPKAILARKNGLEFATVTEAAKKHQPVAVLHCPHVMSWADEERDVTAWLGNELQNEAFSKLYALKEKVTTLKNPDFDYVWSFMQTSDHFYYMATKWLSDGDVHSYFNPYDSAYDAFINYMNVLSDFIIELDKAVAAKAAKKRA